MYDYIKLLKVHAVFSCVCTYSLETATALNQEVYEVLLEVRKVEIKCTILKFVVL